MTDRLNRPSKRGRVTIPIVALLLGLLVLPVIAIVRLQPPIDLRLILAYALSISLVSYFFNRHDKRQAESGAWRTPEATLHFIELIGGWPGAFLAQRVLRHKISKTSYQFVFWVIVFLYQFIAWDSLQDWRFTRHIISEIQHSKHKGPGSN